MDDSGRVVMDRAPSVGGIDSDFGEFVAQVGVDLQRALAPRFGPVVAHEAACDALAYGWQHWDRISRMANPRGYLYRAACHYAMPREPKHTPIGPAPSEAVEFDPGLVPALAELTLAQRSAVYLVDGCGWTLQEVSEMLGVSVSSVRTHRARALRHLRDRLEATDEP